MLFSTPVITFVILSIFFCKSAGQLYELTSIKGKSVPVTLNEEKIIAWKKVRNALITTPILKPMDSHLQVILDVDASDRYTGRVLPQPNVPFSSELRLTLLQLSMDGAFLNIVAFTCRKLTPTQRRYSSQ